VRAVAFPELAGVPFITFIPAVALSAFLAGWLPATICAVIGGVIAELYYIQSAHLLALGLYGLVAGIITASITVAVSAYARLRHIEAERQESFRRQIEERTSERDRLWTLSQDPFLITDRDGIWLAASPAWERILGWPVAELLGRTSVHLLHPDDRDATVHQRGLVFEGHLSVRFQNRYRHRNGGYRWISWNSIAEGDRQYAVARDVTEVRATTEVLQRTQEALVHSQKIEAMGKVTGGVAHDFNNLLTPILGGLDLLQRRGLPDAKAEKLVGGALQAAERARLLVQRLLAFARRQPLRLVSTDVTALIQGLRELIETSLGPRVALELKLAPDLPHVCADAAQLEMALINLAVNARDAMPDGGTVTLTATAVRIAGDGRGLEAGRYVRLTVADTGTGMAPDVIDRAIEPFFSTKGLGRGTGLGLSMVDGLMAQLGGALRIESRPDAGTRVHLWLPEATGEYAAEQAPQPPSAARGSGSALLVDDEELVRDSVGAMLSDLGFDVTQADSGGRALALIAAGERFDLIVTDQMMASMTGTELAAEVRRRVPDQRIILISGYSELDEIAPDLPRLAKPFRQDELARLIGD
jgi:PAS domain S-box-containing protein